MSCFYWLPCLRAVIAASSLQRRMSLAWLAEPSHHLAGRPRRRNLSDVLTLTEQTGDTFHIGSINFEIRQRFGFKFEQILCMYVCDFAIAVKTADYTEIYLFVRFFSIII